MVEDEVVKETLASFEEGETIYFIMEQEDYKKIDEISSAFCEKMPEYQLFFDTKVKGE